MNDDIALDIMKMAAYKELSPLEKGLRETMDLFVSMKKSDPTPEELWSAVRCRVPNSLDIPHLKQSVFQEHWRAVRELKKRIG